jgi:hypothetical protein
LAKEKIMTRMIKTLFKFVFLSAVSLFLISCTDGVGFGSSDTSQSSEYYFECKINGVLTKFNGAVENGRYLNSERREIGITGWLAEKSGLDGGFNIQLGRFQDGVILTTRTYTSPVNASYFLPKQNLFYSALSQDFTVDISELNDVFVKGTFSGNLEYNGSVVTATEGRFYSPHCKINC